MQNHARDGRSVLVTGGAGYVGSHAARALFQAGYTPIVLDNLTTGHRWAVKWGVLIEGDAGNTKLMKRIMSEFGVIAVMHFAASTYVGESMQNPRKYYQNNLVNTLNLLDAMVQADVKHIVFSSTCATYGIPEQMPIPEYHAQNPINPYGHSKLSVEQALQWYGQAYDLHWVSVRYFNAAGASQDGELGEQHYPETHLIPLAIQVAMGIRPHIHIYGTDYQTPDGTAIRDYVHVDDLALAHSGALEYTLSGGASSSFNLGNSQGCSVLEVIRAVERVSGHAIDIRPSSRRSGDPPILIADNAKASKTLGWQPLLSGIEPIIESAYQWHLSHPWSNLGMVDINANGDGKRI